MSGENTRRFDETFQHVTSTGNAGQYDREQIVGEINRLRGSQLGTGAPQLLTDLGKGWHDAADKLDAVRDRIGDVGERLAEVWCSQASAASQRALMRIHDASKDLSGTAYGMHRYLDGVGETMGQHLASFPTGDGEGAVEGFMGDYGRVVASGMAGPAGLLPGNPAGNVGEAVYGTVGSWVDSGLGALGIGGGDPNQQYQEALAALNRDLVATNTLMPNHLSTELPQIDGGTGSEKGYSDGWNSGGGQPGGGQPGGGLPGGDIPGGGASGGIVSGGEMPGGSQSYPGNVPGLPGGAGSGGSAVDSARFVEGTPGGVPAGPGEAGAGLAGTAGGPSVAGGTGAGTGTPGTGGGGLPGAGGGGGGVIGGAGIRPGMTPGIVPMGGAGAGGGRQASAGGAMGRGAGAGTARTGAGGGMMPMGGSGTGSGTGPGGKTGGGRLGGAGGGRAAGGMMPMGGAGGRGSEEQQSSRESWLVEDDDPWGTDEADNVPPGVIK